MANIGVSLPPSVAGPLYGELEFNLEELKWFESSAEADDDTQVVRQTLAVTSRSRVETHVASLLPLCSQQSPIEEWFIRVCWCVSLLR